MKNITYECPMCGYELSINEKDNWKRKDHILCPNCISKNKHIDLEEIERWIRMKKVS